MTTQSDIKKLAEQMAGSMNSFDDIKDFQKQLMQSFIDTALEAEMEDHLDYPKHEKKASLLFIWAVRLFFVQLLRLVTFFSMSYSV